VVYTSWADGWRRVRRAPAVMVGVYATTLLLALPFAYTMRGLIEQHLGRSLVAARVADGVNYDWWQEFAGQASGLGATFTPTIVSFGSTLDSLSRVLDARMPQGPLLLLVAGYLVVWAFLSGGILDRYARQRPTRTHGFFAASGVYFFRFARLAVLAGAAYWLLVGYLHPWLFDTKFRDFTRGLPAERSAFWWQLAFYAVFGLLILAVNVVVDYAKIRMVVEDRRSAVGALLAALRFVARRPGRVIGLYLLNSLVFLLLVAAWSAAAPGVGGTGVGMWLALVVGQIYLLARFAIKLHFLASQTALFQASLAHAAYAAAPVAVWPESPAAEAIAHRRTS